MFQSFLITFRETLEAALVVGVVLSFLVKTNQLSFQKYVWQGLSIGVGLSVVLGIFLKIFYGGLTGRVEQLFEGLLMFVTAGFITWMIVWVHRQKNIVKNITSKIKMHAEKGYGFGILLLIASSVVREGTETVLYLQAVSLTSAENLFLGAFAGIAVALALGYVMFRWAIRVNIHMLFQVTSFILLLFAAGLVSHGVHEFQEVGLLPIFSFDPAINISHILDHNSTIGSFLRTLFGYTSKPTVLEILSYEVYVVTLLWFLKYTDKLLLKKYQAS